MAYYEWRMADDSRSEQSPTMSTLRKIVTTDCLHCPWRTNCRQSSGNVHNRTHRNWCSYTVGNSCICNVVSQAWWISSFNECRPRIHTHSVGVTSDQVIDSVWRSLEDTSGFTSRSLRLVVMNSRHLHDSRVPVKWSHWSARTKIIAQSSDH